MGLVLVVVILPVIVFAALPSAALAHLDGCVDVAVDDQLFQLQPSTLEGAAEGASSSQQRSAEVVVASHHAHSGAALGVSHEAHGETVDGDNGGAPVHGDAGGGIVQQVFEALKPRNRTARDRRRHSSRPIDGDSDAALGQAGGDGTVDTVSAGLGSTIGNNLISIVSTVSGDSIFSV